MVVHVVFGLVYTDCRAVILGTPVGSIRSHLQKKHHHHISRILNKIKQENSVSSLFNNLDLIILFSLSGAYLVYRTDPNIPYYFAPNGAVPHVAGLARGLWQFKTRRYR